MWLIMLVLIVAVLVWQRARVRRLWNETVGARRAWISRSLGSRPTFGALQRAVLSEIARQRTVSVTGAQWLPAVMAIDLAEADHEVIAHAPGAFLRDLEEVLVAMAQSREWRLDGAVQLSFSAERSAQPGLPEVTVLAVAAEHAGLPRPATAVPAPPVAAPPAASALLPPTASAVLPPTTRYGGTGTLVPATELIGAPTAAPGGLYLDPEEDGTDPITLLAGEGAVIGRSHPADIVIADPTVSARHCRLHSSGSTWWIEDLGSSNGTLVNGRRLAQRCELTPGDTVSLGRRTRFQVRI